MKTAFVVQHVHEFDDREDVKLIGVYSSRQRADDAVARLRAAPGFRDAPNAFSVAEYEVDADHWVEGFATVGQREDDDESG